MPIKGVLLILFFVGSLPVCFLRPYYGILLWTIVAFLNPQSALFYWSAALSFPWAVAVAVPTLVGVLIFQGQWYRLASREVFLTVILAVWFTITSIISSNTALFAHHSDDTWLRWSMVTKILIMTMVTIMVVNSWTKLRWFLWVIAGSFGYFVLKAFPFVILTGGQYRVYGPPNSMIADNTDFGLALNMTLPVFFFLAQSESHPWARRFFGALVVMTVPAVFFTYSRGALLGLVLVMGMMFLQLRQRLLIVPVLIFGALIAMLFAPEAWKTRMDPNRPDAIDASARSRFNAWQFSWQLVKDNPIAGGGFATFTPMLFDRYAPNVADIHGPHSIYFQLMAEHGFPGFAIYMMLILSCFVTTHRLVRRAKARGDVIVIQYANMFRFSILGFLASGTFLGRAYFDYIFTIIACIVILKRVVEEEWTQADQEDDGAEPELEEVQQLELKAWQT